MNLDHKSTTITLDWDDITTRTLTKRLESIERNSEIKSIYYRMSAHSGYHILVTFRNPVPVLKTRRLFRDDGGRIINDILNRPSHIHDILWDLKRVDRLDFYAGPWERFK